MSDLPKRRPQPKMIVEKKSPRGLVPSSTFGITDLPYNSLLDQIDPRNNPHAQLALAASTDKRFRMFMEIVNKPPFNRYSLATCAKKLEISITEFADFWRKANTTRAIARAAERLPEITNDMADDAMTQKEACGRCDGWGFVKVAEDDMPELVDGGPVPGNIRPMGQKWVRDCPQCNATGKISKAGDSHARDKILLMNGISTGKSAGVNVSINNFGGMGIENAGGRMSAVTFDVSAESGGDSEYTEEEERADDESVAEVLEAELMEDEDGSDNA